MFEMRPVFVVALSVNGRREPFPPPRMAIVEAASRVVDGDGYFFRLTAVPWLPWRVCEAFVRLEGVSVPEGGELDYHDKLRTEAVKAFVSRRVQEAKMVTLRNFRRDGAGRVLADLYADGHGLAALLSEVARGEESWDNRYLALK